MIKRLYALVAVLALVAASSQAAACEVRCASHTSCHSSMAADHAPAMNTVHNDCPHAIKPVAINSIRLAIPAICAHTFNWAAVLPNARAETVMHPAPQMAAALPGAQRSAMVAEARQARIYTSPPPFVAASDPLRNSLRL